MQMQGIHTMLAMLTNQPILQLRVDEAEQLADALIELQSHYDIPVNAKTLAWIQLTAVAGMIYLPRFMAIRMNATSIPSSVMPATPEETRPQRGQMDFSHDING